MSSKSSEVDDSREAAPPPVVLAIPSRHVGVPRASDVVVRAWHTARLGGAVLGTVRLSRRSVLAASSRAAWPKQESNLNPPCNVVSAPTVKLPSHSVISLDDWILQVVYLLPLSLIVKQRLGGWGVRFIIQCVRDQIRVTLFAPGTSLGYYFPVSSHLENTVIHSVLKKVKVQRFKY